MELRFVPGVTIPLLLFSVLPLMAQTGGLEEARRAVEETASHNVSVLRGLMDQVPPEAKSSLDQAIAASEAGRAKALADLDRAERGLIPPDRGIVTALEAVDQGTQRHLDELRGLLDKVPEQAKPAIQRALEVSRTGRETALGRLRAIREGRAVEGVGPGAIGRPEGLGPPAGIGRPETSPPGPPAGLERPGGPPGGFRPSGPGRGR